MGNLQEVRHTSVFKLIIVFIENYEGFLTIKACQLLVAQQGLFV